MILSKNINNKKCASKLVFFNEKKNEKDLDDFWQLAINPELEIQSFPSGMLILGQKSF